MRIFICLCCCFLSLKNYAQLKDKISNNIIVDPSVFEVSEKAACNYPLITRKVRFMECKAVPESEEDKCFNEYYNRHLQSVVHLERPFEDAGEAVIQFCVNTDGSVKVLSCRGTTEYARKEAILAVQKLPKFIPAQHRGRPIPSYFQSRIIFKFR